MYDYDNYEEHKKEAGSFAPFFVWFTLISIIILGVLGWIVFN